MNTTTLLWLARGSYLSLFVVLSYWFYLALPDINRPYVMGGILYFLLLAPVPGMIKARPYTLAWSAMLILVYFTHSILELYDNDAMSNLALIELIASLTYFVSAGMYARIRGRALKLETKK